ncbi:MAG: 50S ribosomal protein L15 [Gammaproteobacteria bacterium]|nr:50S ribosomal protein L15 [Gammaproteobacteria bacterium]
MRLNDLHPAEGSRPAKKRVGRGISAGQGKTAGRGVKGAKSRAGGGIKPGFEGGQMPLQRRLPKLGFTSRIGRVTAEVRSSELAKVAGDLVTLETLKAARVVRRNMKRARIVLSGGIDRALVIQGVPVTAGVRAAVEAAGGRIEDAPVADASIADASADAEAAATE